MQTSALGSSSLRVSSLGLGTWRTFTRGASAGELRSLLRFAYDQGIRFFDTADSYENGEAEHLLGQACRALPRQEIVIATKAYFRPDGTPGDLARNTLRAALGFSLQRLGLEQVDLYQCHRFDARTPLVDTCAAMDEFRKQGLIREWGVCRFDAEQMTEVIAICERESLAKPVSHQWVYNLFTRDAEQKVFPSDRALGVSSLVYSPLAQGVLAGRYRSASAAPDGSRAASEQTRATMWDYSDEKLQLVRAWSARLALRGLDSSCVALAWCLRLPQVASVLIGASSKEQLAANVRAASLPWLDEYLEGIEKGDQR